MAAGKYVCLTLLLIGLEHGSSLPRASESQGRKLFGGYRIVPKECQPTIPSRVKSTEPAICMFNYECSRRNGEVVGACMDGFLFGACCQLPGKYGQDEDPELNTQELLHLHEIDHVPEIPILLNPDGTPVGTGGDDSLKGQVSGSNSIHPGTLYTKISTLTPSSGSMNDAVENAEKPQLQQADISHLEQDFPALLGQQEVLNDLRLPGLLAHQGAHNDIQEQQDSGNPMTTLLRPDQVLQIADPVDQLPALFSHGLGPNNHSSADTILLNENGTLLEETHRPDEIFRPGTPATSIRDATPTSTATTTITTTTTGTTKRVTPNLVTLDSKKKVTVTMVTDKRKVSTAKPEHWVKFPEHAATEQERPTTFNRLPEISETRPVTAPVHYMSSSKLDGGRPTEERVSSTVSLKSSSSGVESTTPLTASSYVSKDDLVRVPTITYDVQSGNKKNDILDKEEIAINHIISILNDTTPGPENKVTVKIPSSPQGWVSIDETSKPSLVKVSTSRSPSTSTTTETFPYTFYKPAKPSSSFYNYELVPTETGHSTYTTSNSFSRPSTQTTYGPYSSFGYSSRPTTNPPAPTVIVLGPLGTEFTTDTTQKAVTRSPSTPRPEFVKPSTVSTKKPNVSTTITHNISTVISTGTVSSNNNHVVSTSYISVNLKDATSSRPSTGSTESSSLKDQATKRPTIWTTISAWSGKPSFRPKPSAPNFTWPDENAIPVNTAIIIKEPVVDAEIITVTKTTLPACEEDTAAPDDLINFPPVRNPNLNISAPSSQQEKPTMVDTVNNVGYPNIEIVSENEIPTPTFIEDDVLTNKVDAFVNKIVESLQGNFMDLKDIVYNGGNATSSPATPTRRPSGTSSPSRRPTRRPATSSRPGTSPRPGQTTRRPTTRRPTARPSRPTSGSQRPERPNRPQRPGTTRPRPTTLPTTRRPQSTTKRPRPTRRPVTTIPTSTLPSIVEYEATSPAATEPSSTSEETSATPDFRNQCGVRPLIKSGRIVGGKGATFGEWPWQVLVREATWLGLFTKNKCGGVLITDKYVITAAHCQPGFLASLVAVFGEFDISGELESKRSITRNVRRVIVNRGYDPATFENDLALLELESPVQFDAHIVPICMPDDSADFTGRMATVTGWGRLKYNGGVPSVLQEVQVPIMENSVCQEMFQTAGHSKLILESFLCAGYANGQKDSCEGDSGGPLVMERPDGRWILVGTVSHGIKCAAPYLPGVYMRTTYFKPWLHSITGV